MPELTFGQWVKQRRKELDLTQDELSTWVGCSLVLIQKIEASERRPSKQIAELLAERLNIPADERHEFIHFARAGSTLFPVAQAAPWRSLRRHFTNLPVQPTPLFGRQQAVEAVKKLILADKTRLLTLVGPPGIGKTRLGIAAAAQMVDDFEDGVFIIPLATITDPELVVSSLARTLDLKENTRQPILNRIINNLADKRLLLLLDNFEQVVTAAPIVAEFLAACPWIQILATSRVPLHIRAERQFHVPPLGLVPLIPVLDQDILLQYPSAALFVDRAQAVQPDFKVSTINAPVIAEICARVDGLPLAIELVAARISQMSLQSLLDHLSNRLALLIAGPSDLPARHQTLRNAIGWSFELLDLDEQVIFSRLGIFVGGCTLKAARIVCSSDPLHPLPDILTRFVDGNLLLRNMQEDGQARFSMLETIREYALERLEGSSEAETIRKRHATCFLEVAEQAEPIQKDWLYRLEMDHDNFRAALHWAIDRGETEVALRLVGALGRFWQLHGHLSEGLAWMNTVLNLEDTRTNPTLARARAKALIGAGWLLRDMGDFGQTKAFFDESLALYEQLADRAGLAYALYSAGYADFLIGDSQQGIRGIEESLALYRAINDRGGAALALFMLGRIAVGQGNYENGHTYLAECLKMEQESGATFGIARTFGSLGELAIYRGDFLSAANYLEQCQALLNKLGEKQLRGWVLTKRGELAWYQGDLSLARKFLERSLELAREVGYRWNEAYSLSYLGRVALTARDLEGAQSMCESGLALFNEMGSEEDIAQTKKDLAQVLVQCGSYERAQDLYSDCLMVFKKRGYLPDIAECLEGMAMVRENLGNPCGAVRLLGAAYTLREILGSPLAPVLVASHEHLVTAIRTQLDEVTFDVAWKLGCSLSWEQALDD